MEMKLTKKASSLVVMIIAAIIFVLSIVAILSPKPNLIETKGTIVEIEKQKISDEDYNYTVYVDYMANGKQHKHVEFGNYNSSMRVNSKVVIMFDPDNPEHIEAKNSEGELYLIAVASGILLALSIAQNVLKKGIKFLR